MLLIDRRIGLLFAAFLALLGLASARAAYLGVIKAPGLRRAAATQQIQDVRVPAPRGTISDRRGEILAVSEPSANVVANPYLIAEKGRAAPLIARALGLDPLAVLRKLSQPGTGYVYLARNVPAERAQRLQRLKVEGLSFEPTMRRSYPQGWLAAQVIGSVGTEGVGLTGLEYGRERILSGRDGRRHVVDDARGEPLSLRDARSVRPGTDLGLTLDSAMQAKAEAVLQQVGATYRPRHATAIVMDPRSSDLLALANWPRVNAADIGSAPADARRDHAVAYTYEPGSTFKAFTVAAALQDRLVRPDTRFDLPPTITLFDRTIGESHARGPVTLTTAEILAQSSNVGAIKIGLEIGARRFSRWIPRFGFGRRTGVDLPGEEIGIVPTYAQYSGSSMGNLPIGQGQSVTPMQMAVAYASIANGGILRPARVIREVGGRPAPVARGHRVISAATAASVRRMLEGVLAPGGTASEAAIPGYVLAGKTGTANKVDPATGEYSKSRYVASFMGFAPAQRPRLLVSVVVDEPQGAIYGGEVAAPAFQRIMAFALPYLGIPPT